MKLQGSLTQGSWEGVAWEEGGFPNVLTTGFCLFAPGSQQRVQAPPIALSLLWVSDRSLVTRIRNGLCLCPESLPQTSASLSP